MMEISQHAGRCDRHAGDAFPTRCYDCDREAQLEAERQEAAALDEAEAARSSFFGHR